MWQSRVNLVGRLCTFDAHKDQKGISGDSFVTKTKCYGVSGAMRTLRTACYA